MDLVNVPLTQTAASTNYSAGNAVGGQSVAGNIAGNTDASPAAIGVAPYRGAANGDTFSFAAPPAPVKPHDYWQSPSPVASPAVPPGMEKVSGFIDHATHQLYVPVNVMDEVSHASPYKAEADFKQVSYTKTKAAPADDTPAVEITADENAEGVTTEESTKGGDAKDTKKADASTNTKTDTKADSSKTTSANSKTPETLTEEQQAVAEFMQAYSALQESIQDPDVNAALERMRNRLLNPWSINPFGFLKDLNTIRKDDSVKKFLKESKDLGPYWDKLKAQLPEPTTEKTTTTVTKTTKPERPVHRHPHPRPPAPVDDEPTIIPIDSLSPELLAELMQS